MAYNDFNWGKAKAAFGLNTVEKGRFIPIVEDALCLWQKRKESYETDSLHSYEKERQVNGDTYFASSR